MEFQRVLIVEDDPSLRAAIVRVVARSHAEIIEAASVAEGLERLAVTCPDLILLDVRLPDGSGVQLAEAAGHCRPKPTLVAISGEATAAEAFELGQAGVAHFVSKPFTLEQLLETVEAAHRWVPEIGPLVAESVGKRELLDVVSTVRGTMVDEALAKADGSRRGAAKQLGVSRQAVQQIVRKREEGLSPAEPGPPSPSGDSS
jgi:two-component system response regulator RegA